MISQTLAQKSLLLASALLAAGAAQAETVAVTAAQMVDVVAGRMVANPVVVITDGKVVAAGAGVAIPAGARRIDLPGLTLLPGFIDMHVHLSSDPTIGGYRGLEYARSFGAAIGVAHARKTIDAGFTTVRNVGSGNLDDIGLKQAIEGGYVPGPRIVPATYAIGATGGHCDATEFQPEIKVETPGVADGVDGVRAKVRQIRKMGAEVIKFCGTGGVFSKTTTVGGQQYSLAEMTALVTEAHMLGLKVAVHAHGTSGIKDAIRAGADTIEHASLADAEAFDLAKKAGTAFSMDIYNDTYILAEGEKNGVFAESLAKEKEIGLKQRQTFQAAHKAGVTMVFGSDAGVYPHGDNALQFQNMVEWGMTPMEAIKAATVNAARYLDRPVGQLTPGRFGDIIAVAGDPTQDVKLLRNIAVVIKGGVIVKDAR